MISLYGAYPAPAQCLEQPGKANLLIFFKFDSTLKTNVEPEKYARGQNPTPEF